jgi:integrase/recombinase XerD
VTLYLKWHPVQNIHQAAFRILKKAAAQKAGIQKNSTMHTLRQTFSTHCLENRVDLRYIQNMLGHDSTKTIEIATQVTTKGFDQIESPLDKLDI